MADLDIDRNYLSKAIDAFDASQAGGTVALTYTCPGGKTAILRYVASKETVVGFQTFAVEWVRGATVVELELLTSDIDVAFAAVLDAADLVRIAIVTPGAGGTTQALLMCIEERSARRNN